MEARLAGLKPLMENTLEFTVAREVDEAVTQHAALRVLEGKE